MQDLNISNDDYTDFNVEVVFEDGRVFKAYEMELDLNNMRDEQRPCRFILSDVRSIGRFDLSIRFRRSDINANNGRLVLSPEKLLECSVFNFSEKEMHTPEEIEKVNSGYYCEKNVKSVTFSRCTYGDVSRFVV